MANKRNQHTKAGSLRHSRYSSGYSGGYHSSASNRAKDRRRKHRSQQQSARYNKRAERSRKYRTRRSKHSQPSSRIGNNGFFDKNVATIPTSNGEILLTRRHFLYGALGAGALVAAGAGVKAYTSAKASESAISVLSVPQSAVTESTDLLEVENGGKMSLTAEISLPYGTLMWSTNDDVAALLLPTETGSPLTTVSILRLSSGYYFSVLNQAVSSAEGFEIYDVRASSEALVWTEENILEGVWRIYGATLSETSIGTPYLLDQGTSDWETPSIAICGKEAFWQVLPNTSGAQKSAESTLRCAPITSGTATGTTSTAASTTAEGTSTRSNSQAGTQADTSSDAQAAAATNYEVVLSSTGRMCTPLYASDNQLTVTPRADASGVYYQLTTIDATTHEISDTLTLPQSMKPLEAGYGKTGFMFSFEGIYNYGDGIANLGTYAPKNDTRKRDYSAAPWFHFARTPSAPPCWCNNYLVVKSTRSVVGVDLTSDTYFLLDSVSGSDTYGDYLASTGNRNRILIYANINDETLSDNGKYCSARIYTAN